LYIHVAKKKREKIKAIFQKVIPEFMPDPESKEDAP